MQGWRESLQHVDLCFSEEFTNVDIVRPFTPISPLTTEVKQCCRGPKRVSGFVDVCCEFVCEQGTEFDLLIKVYPIGKMSAHIAALKVGDTMLARPHKSFVNLRCSNHVVLLLLLAYTV